MLARCKPYFQCLLGLPDLFARGLRRLPHTAPVAYYEAVLASDAPGDLSERTGKDELKAITDKAGGQRKALMPRWYRLGAETASKRDHLAKTPSAEQVATALAELRVHCRGR